MGAGQGPELGVQLVALVGSRTLQQLENSLGALRLTLAAEDLRRIEQALPTDAVAGTRYAAREMGFLDSEKQFRPAAFR